jgi:hypothetical protein
MLAPLNILKLSEEYSLRWKVKDHNVKWYPSICIVKQKRKLTLSALISLTENEATNKY